MPTYRTPDVYVEEISVFPPSVAEVETAIPAFIGYTEKGAPQDHADPKPVKIYSFKEYESYFGLAKPDAIAVRVDAAGAVEVTEPALSYLLYYSVKMFFDNGGGQCYIVSVGDHSATIGLTALEDGLDAVAMEDEPTLLVIPDAVKLGYADFKSLTQKMLDQCGTLGDRFAILDVWNGDKKPGDDVVVGHTGAPPADVTERVIAASRDAWTGNLKYGAAYYPFVKTTMNYFVDEGESNVDVTLAGAAAADLSTF